MDVDVELCYCGEEKCNQNGVNYLFLIVKSIKVTSGFISKVMKKFLGGATVELFDF